MRGRGTVQRAAAGPMDKQVTIQSATRSDDGGGGYTETRVDFATVWMAVEPLEGREQLTAMQTGMQRPYRFTCRYLPGVTGALTLLYDGRTFDVRSVVDPEEKHRILVMLAEQVSE